MPHTGEYAQANQPNIWIAPALLNSWANFGGSFNPAGYYRDASGVVRLRGVVKTGAVGTVIFTLPAGFRPINTELMPVVSNSAFGLVQVGSNGDVTAAGGSSTWFSLDGITFRAL